MIRSYWNTTWSKENNKSLVKCLNLEDKKEEENSNIRRDQEKRFYLENKDYNKKKLRYTNSVRELNQSKHLSKKDNISN
jgi:hypothetical protein